MANDRIDEDFGEEDGDQHGKKRSRVQRACDLCRRKKIRCDGLQPEKGACSNCASYGHQCTFVDAAKRRAPPRSYVIALEARMERAERLISQLLPNVEINKAIGPMPELPSDVKKDTDDGEAAEGPRDQNADRLPDVKSMHIQDTSEVSNGTVESYERLEYNDTYDEDEEDAAFVRVKMENVNLLDLTNSWITAFKGGKNRSTEVYDIALAEQRQLDQTSANEKGREAPLLFYGQASGVHIFPHLTRIMRADDRNSPSPTRPINNASWSYPSTDVGLSPDGDLDWPTIAFRWPEPDVEEKLLDVYFKRVNPQFPVLNEVVFRRMLSKPNWKDDDRDASLLALGTFALGTRYLTDDEISKYPGFPSMGEYWATLHHNLVVRNAVPLSAGLGYIQSILLSLIYVQADPMPRSTIMWIMLGVVIRLLQDMGAHRKFTATSSNFALVTEETYRRLWWVTYVLDRLLSSDMGRPVAIQDEDTDLDEILLVDDEYIVRASEAGTKPEQPQDRPSVYHGFAQVVRLSRIIGRTLRTIYAISKSKAARGFVGQKWDAYIVAEIDKSLNGWLEQVPSHLAYSPLESNKDWLVQSSRIFLLYHYTQTLVHRPFVQRYKLDSPLTFHSLAIVSNAARSGIHVIDNLVQRGCASLIGPEVPMRLVIFGSYLLLISFSAVQKKFSVSSALLNDARKCVESLHAIERTWKLARRMAIHLGSMLERLDIPPSSSMCGVRDVNVNKRFLDEGSSASDTSMIPNQGQSQHAATQREIRTMRQSNGLSNSNTQEDDAIASKLPLSTSELQGPFKDSPQSAFDQVAALSGWSQERNAPSDAFRDSSNAGRFGNEGQGGSNSAGGTSSIAGRSSGLQRGPDGSNNPHQQQPAQFDLYRRFQQQQQQQQQQQKQQQQQQPNVGMAYTAPPPNLFGAYDMAALNGPQHAQAYNGGLTDDAQSGMNRGNDGPAAMSQMYMQNATPSMMQMGGAPASGLRNDPFLGSAPPVLTPGFEYMLNAQSNAGQAMGMGGQGIASNATHVPATTVGSIDGEPAAWTATSTAGPSGATLTSDPLDALSNINGFWSDSDWMRALQSTLR